METNQEPKSASAAKLNETAEKPHALEYARNLFQNVVAWYNNAEAKAQILLGLVGAFVTFLTASAFATKDDLKPVLDVFGLETWILLGVTFFCLIASIVCALMCLRSRRGPVELRGHGEVDEINRDEGSFQQSPETLWYFGDIARLAKRERFQERIAEMTVEDEIRALGSQIFILSKSVTQKHWWVNLAFGFIVATLILFMLSGVSYVYHVKRLPTAATSTTAP